MNRTRRQRARTPLNYPDHTMSDLRRTILERCCEKRRYASKEEALREIVRLATAPEPVTGLSTYKCPEGWWHLTSSSPTRRIAIGAARARKRTAGGEAA